MSGNPLYSTRQWRAVRAYVLARDGYVCQVRGIRCTCTATEADHIVELTAGGAPYDPANLRAACKPCNASRGATHGNRTRHTQPSRQW